MAIEDSYNLIHQMAADSHDKEMMCDPEMRAQAEAAEREYQEWQTQQGNSWAGMAAQAYTHDPPQAETDR